VILLKKVFCFLASYLDLTQRSSSGMKTRPRCQETKEGSSRKLSGVFGKHFAFPFEPEKKDGETNPVLALRRDRVGERTVIRWCEDGDGHL